MGVYKTLEEEFDFDIIDEFMDHFEVMSETMEPTIVSLADTTDYDDKIEALFRIFHNLKSASGFLKMPLLNRLSEFAENVMEEARKTNGPASEEFTNWLLMVSDQYAKWYDDLIRDNEEFTPLNFDIFNTPTTLEVA